MVKCGKTQQKSGKDDKKFSKIQKTFTTFYDAPSFFTQQLHTSVKFCHRPCCRVPETGQACEVLTSAAVRPSSVFIIHTDNCPPQHNKAAGHKAHTQ